MDKAQNTVAEIRARHSAKDKIDPSGAYRIEGYSYPETLLQTQRDLATLMAENERLIRELDKARADAKQLRARRRALKYKTWRV